MMEKDDWRLLNNVQHLIYHEVNVLDGEDIIEHLPNIESCIFCWNKVSEGKSDFWYLPIDKSCCICENCFKDFNGIFKWRFLDGWDILW